MNVGGISRKESFAVTYYYRFKMTNKCVKEPVGFINVFQIYTNMFRQVVAIFRGP
jgi:hypothetical protein